MWLNRTGSMYQARIIAAVLAIPRAYKRLIAISVDSALCVIAVWLAYCLRLDGWVALEGEDWLPVGVSLLLALPIFISFGLYRAIFRYAGVAAFLAILRAMVIYFIGFMSAFTIISVPGVPRTVGILQPLLLLVFISVSRLAARYWLGTDYRRQLNQLARPNVLIYGDSFTNALETLLYASFNEMRALDLRHYTGMKLSEYIEKYRPDVVICVRDDSSFLMTGGNGAAD